jgi:hypothetical protein
MSSAHRRSIRWLGFVLSTVAALTCVACGGSQSPSQLAAAAPAVTGPTCTDWSAWDARKQSDFVRSHAGRINLALRVEGTTSACLNLAADLRDVSAVAAQVQQVASSWTQPVRVKMTDLPPTTNPADPHQCFERVNAIANPTNANMPKDCLAMGF